ncbi:MAG: lysophospholipid acyltransferase family protein [Candidatus Lernaella stagnicola]|nr:lysophospholipid acyltransferase family protein [Candidatus Lernaella stagnicola]
MTPWQRRATMQLAERILPADEFERLQTLETSDNGFGYDDFGVEKESAVLGYCVARLLYKYWLRVESFGHENIPPARRGLIVPNHSGVVPIDGGMIWFDLLLKMKKPRLMRAMVDNFMGFLPFVNTMMYRCGQVVGARRNFTDLLDHDELVTVFPEGTRGIGKPYSQRYHLVRFNVGFVELSLLHRAPIIPTAIIGGEEQAPMLGDIKPLARMFQFPYFPITPLFPWLGPLGAIPLPVKYYIYYGEPMHFYETYSPETVNDLETIRMLATKVQMAVQDMVNEGLKKRESVFGFFDDDGDGN